MVEIVEARDELALDDDAERAHDQGREDERGPITDAGVVEQHPGHEGAHHVERAVREVDDVEEAEDDREAKAQDGVERAVDEPEQELAEEGGRGNAENGRHAAVLTIRPKGSGRLRTPVSAARVRS